MGSLTGELRRREADARAEADRLRTRTGELAEDLARAEEQVTRLAIGREEVTRVLEEPAAAAGRRGCIGAAAGLAPAATWGAREASWPGGPVKASRTGPLRSARSVG